MLPPFISDAKEKHPAFIFSVIRSRMLPPFMTLNINVGCLSLALEMNGGNIRLRKTLKINVGCFSLASETNGGNIRLHMTLKVNVGCFSLASEMNGGNIRLRMTLKINVGCFSLASEMNCFLFFCLAQSRGAAYTRVRPLRRSVR